MGVLWQDLRYGLRMLAKNPGVTAVAVLTLALGIGATSAIFSAVYGVLLRPLPYPQPDQIVELREVSAQGQAMNFADPNFEDLRSQSRALAAAAEYGAWVESVSGGSGPRRTMVASVSRDFFSVMGVEPIAGRAFAAQDQHVGAAPVALLSDGYWKQYLGDIAEFSTVKLNIENRPYSVIGVLPLGFRFPFDSDIWVPRELSKSLPSRSAHNWRVVGRLRDVIPPAQARAELSGIARQLKQQYGQDTMMTDVAVSPLRDARTAGVRPALRPWLGAVRFRLSVAGGGLGVLAAFWGVDTLVALAPPNLPRLEDVSINLPVLLFALAVSVWVAAGLGISTALRAAPGNLQGALVERGQGQAGTPGSQRLGRLIVAGQLAITL